MGSISEIFKITRYFSVSHLSAGFVAVLVGYTSAAVIIFQAAEAAGASTAQISSWLWALGIGMGLSTIVLSLYFRAPVLTAWSTPGAALLVTALSGASLNEAVGIFMFSSGLILLCGVTGWFEKMMRHVPMSLAGGMLAGVLLQFGMDLFRVLADEFLLVAVMLAVYILAKHALPRYVIPLVLVSGGAIAFFQGQLQLETLSWQVSAPVWVTPDFSLAKLIGVGIPLFIVTMASQNVPGVATLRANGYQTPVSPLITCTGFTGVLLAPFGGFAFNLAAITAAICQGKEAGADPEKRYLASVWAGGFYLLTGLFGASIVALFAAFPSGLVMAVAGLALLGTIGNSLSASLARQDEREAALLTFLVTASGISLAGISSAFWGLVIGLLAYHLPQTVAPYLSRVSFSRQAR
ncbi:benzoate/H(+) symporter BenE family transporter [Thalassomonas viridans]|uniref:Benzoate/H(+) symporter BenE family transporter n=1 Tax=Thalassomonas viridans TaxID=137584 RepID=A0AAE9YYD0_9GAMM|nr:benzoate/H(+) symporter BenE family transporter [Thalassomonas viridans]WDE03198.1 benzoate/H(+) symporter BenE family transporter [Thalassomonas viridans]